MSPENDASPAPPGPSHRTPPDVGDSSADSPFEPLETLVRRRASPPPPYRPPNHRRSDLVLRYFLVLLTLFLAFAAVVTWAYFTRIVPVLSSAPPSAAAPAPPPVARAVAVQLPDQTLKDIAAATAQISELRQQLDSLRARQDTLDRQPPSADPSSRPSTPPFSTADAAGLATEAPPTSPFDPPDSVAAAELRLLKERNRLTAHADECVSTGLRRHLNLIIDAMRDPARANLYHAAQAEYYRVMGHYQLLNRIDPAYKLPTAELFPGEKIRDEADLSTPQLISLLDNKDHPWQVRLRSAFLLGGRRTPEVGDALVRALSTDPSLDVAKEAQLSFEQNVSRNFLLFDISGVQSWWRSQTSGQPADSPSQPATPPGN